MAFGDLLLSGGGATGFYRWDGSSWSARVDFPTGLSNGEGIAVDPTNGDVVVADFSTSTTLAGFYRYDGSTWSGPTLYPVTGVYVGIGVGPNGHVHVLRRPTGSSGSNPALIYTHDGSSWDAGVEAFDPDNNSSGLDWVTDTEVWAVRRDDDRVLTSDGSSWTVTFTLSNTPDPAGISVHPTEDRVVVLNQGDGSGVDFYTKTGSYIGNMAKPSGVTGGNGIAYDRYDGTTGTLWLVDNTGDTTALYRATDITRPNRATHHVDLPSGVTGLNSLTMIAPDVFVAKKWDGPWYRIDLTTPGTATATVWRARGDSSEDRVTGAWTDGTYVYAYASRRSFIIRIRIDDPTTSDTNTSLSVTGAWQGVEVQGSTGYLMDSDNNGRLYRFSTNDPASLTLVRSNFGFAGLNRAIAWDGNTTFVVSSNDNFNVYTEADAGGTPTTYDQPTGVRFNGMKWVPDPSEPTVSTISVSVGLSSPELSTRAGIKTRVGLSTATLEVTRPPPAVNGVIYGYQNRFDTPDSSTSLDYVNGITDFINVSADPTTGDLLFLRSTGTSRRYHTNGTWGAETPKPSGLMIVGVYVNPTTVDELFGVSNLSEFSRYDGSVWIRDRSIPTVPNHPIRGFDYVNDREMWARNSSGDVYSYDGSTWTLRAESTIGNGISVNTVDGGFITTVIGGQDGVRYYDGSGSLLRSENLRNIRFAAYDRRFDRSVLVAGSPIRVDAVLQDQELAGGSSVASASLSSPGLVTTVSTDTETLDPGSLTTNVGMGEPDLLISGPIRFDGTPVRALPTLGAADALITGPLTYEGTSQTTTATLGSTGLVTTQDVTLEPLNLTFVPSLSSPVLHKVDSTVRVTLTGTGIVVTGGLSSPDLGTGPLVVVTATAVASVPRLGSATVTTTEDVTHDGTALGINVGLSSLGLVTTQNEVLDPLPMVVVPIMGRPLVQGNVIYAVDSSGNLYLVNPIVPDDDGAPYGLVSTIPIDLTATLRDRLEAIVSVADDQSLLYCIHTIRTGGIRNSFRRVDISTGAFERPFGDTLLPLNNLLSMTRIGSTVYVMEEGSPNRLYRFLNPDFPGNVESLGNVVDAPGFVGNRAASDMTTDGRDILVVTGDDDGNEWLVRIDPDNPSNSDARYGRVGTDTWTNNDGITALAYVAGHVYVAYQTGDVYRVRADDGEVRYQGRVSFQPRSFTGAFVPLVDHDVRLFGGPITATYGVGRPELTGGTNIIFRGLRINGMVIQLYVNGNPVEVRVGENIIHSL